MIPYRSDELHDCGGTIRAGEPMGCGAAYYYCDRCDAFRFDDADGLFPTGTDQQANRDAWDNGDLRSPDAPADWIGAPLAVGDTVQVRGQDIRGVILRLHGTTAIVHDATLPVCDAELEFRFCDLRRVATAAECGAAPDDSGDDAEREPWPPADDRPEHAPQPDDAPEDPPDPDGDWPMVPTGGAS